MKGKRLKPGTAVYFSVIIAIIMALNYAGGRLFPADVDGELQVHFIDVGQAESILIRTEDKNMLIDGGTDHETDTVLSYLEEQGVERLDIVVATHPHEDHIGGLDGVIEMFGADTVYMPGADASTDTYLEFLEFLQDYNVVISESGDEFSLGDARFRVVAPNKSHYSELNNYSLCLYMTYGSNSFLFNGDAEKMLEREIIESGYVVSADVFKVSHHGSKNSNSAEFLELVKPSISVISVGSFNKYELPDDEVIKRLEKYGKVYRTDLNGNIVITSDGNKLEVQCDNN